MAPRPMVSFWIWPIALLAIAGLFLIVQYNKLVGLRLRIRESWANVDVELKRRHDLIPNLVETVKGYARHEQALLARLAELRSFALAQEGDTGRRRDAERDVAAALGRVLAVAEAYPQLKANENFLQLQRQLVETEDRIQAARRFYNGNVRDYNNQVQQFPSNLVARSFRFAAHEYFELPSVAERAVPVVEV
jgi:LemA protein